MDFFAVQVSALNMEEQKRASIFVGKPGNLSLYSYKKEPGTGMVLMNKKKEIQLFSVPGTVFT